MNSIIDAQAEFTNVFGEITLRDLVSDLVLPTWSNERLELDAFIDAHQQAAPVVIELSIFRGPDQTLYQYVGHQYVGDGEETETN